MVAQNTKGYSGHSATAVAGDRKRKTYEGKLNAGDVLVPFAVDTMGNLGPEAGLFLQKLADNMPEGADRWLRKFQLRVSSAVIDAHYEFSTHARRK